MMWIVMITNNDNYSDNDKDKVNNDNDYNSIKDSAVTDHYIPSP